MESFFVRVYYNGVIKTLPFIKSFLLGEFQTLCGSLCLFKYARTASGSVKTKLHSFELSVSEDE